MNKITNFELILQLFFVFHKYSTVFKKYSVKHFKIFFERKMNIMNCSYENRHSLVSPTKPNMKK